MRSLRFRCDDWNLGLETGGEDQNVHLHEGAGVLR